jgi:hypothetical protein
MEDQDLKKEILELWGAGGRTGRIRTRGQSMEPLLQDGDEIEFRAGRQEPRFGDLILFFRSDRLVAHRVIGRRFQDGKPMVLEKGDKSSQASLIPVDLIQGKVIRIMKPGRIILLESPVSRMMGKMTAVCSLIDYGLSQQPSLKKTIPFLSQLSNLALKVLASLPARKKPSQ